MSISLVAHAVAGSSDNNDVTTPGINTTGANFLVIAVGSFATGAVPIVSDSKSNSWTQLTNYQSGNIRITMFWSSPTTVGAAHTFTANGTSIFPSICVAAFSGATASPFDTQTGNNGGSSITSIQPGSLTPAGSNELIITALGQELSAGTFSVDSGFTITDQIGWSSGNYFGTGLAYLVQGSAAAENPTWSWPSSANAASAIAAFKGTAPSSVKVPIAAYVRKQNIVGVGVL
jgi:hypothetical protein